MERDGVRGPAATVCVRMEESHAIQYTVNQLPARILPPSLGPAAQPVKVWLSLTLKCHLAEKYCSCDFLRGLSNYLKEHHAAEAVGAYRFWSLVNCCFLHIKV